ncbi:phosphatase 2C-like domain-containing protein [Crucibulum laeve]|uniref:Phosphatase 2C-like domain-containing protein n=1 Tax=Crucibulum laeve TaxID=68775 RepID=A0A5C3LIK7_9AGAR|nr:phosphatase 2C-like domain-containing protein [Crucibulum laeve]
MNNRIHTSQETHAGICIHVVQYQPTERPIEDRFSIDFEEHSKRLIVGVYDGHGGVATSDHISKVLPAAILGSQPSDHAKTFEAVDSEMLTAFQKDHSLFRSKSSKWVQNADVIKSGCTALVLEINVDDLTALFANAGDCRLVIANSNGDQEALLQTTDLNAKSLSEQERLAREHPGEELVVVSGRLFGKLMSTRGFGDGYYKLPTGILNRQHKKYINVLSSIETSSKVPMSDQYDSYFYGYKTPPYVVSTPVTGLTQLEKGNFVIMATDGLWDLVSTDDAVRIVQEGIVSAAESLANYLLDTVMSITPPGDDVTIIILRL